MRIAVPSLGAPGSPGSMGPRHFRGPGKIPRVIPGAGRLCGGWLLAAL